MRILHWYQAVTQILLQEVVCGHDPYTDKRLKKFVRAIVILKKARDIGAISLANRGQESNQIFRTEARRRLARRDITQPPANNAQQSLEDAGEHTSETETNDFNSSKERPDNAKAALTLLQQFRSTWDCCLQIINIQRGSMVGYQPHPLLPLIVHLRRLLDACFKGFAHLEGAERAKDAMDSLLDTLISAEPDTFDAAPEVTNSWIIDMEVFLENISVQFGDTVVPTIEADVAFLRKVQQQIDAYGVQHEVMQKEFVERTKIAVKDWDHRGVSNKNAQNKPAGAEETAEYVTLAEAADLADTPKKTLEDWKQKGKLPAPKIPHAGRRSAKWDWSELRPNLEQLTGMELPKCPAQ